MKPINYAISLYDLEFGGSYSYQGTVKIDLDVKKDTREIVLNALQLKIYSAEVVTTHTKSRCSRTFSHAVADAKSEQLSNELKYPTYPTMRSPSELPSNSPTVFRHLPRHLLRSNLVAL